MAKVIEPIHKEIGKYVSYKGNVHVVIGVRDKNVRIFDPINDSKRLVSLASVTWLRYTPMTVVEHGMGTYLRSKKNIIISLTSGKVMKWTEDNRNRVTILAAL